jgi:hypothetical protein
MNQLPLFGFRDMKPKARVPISRERIEEAKKLFQGGDIKGSVEVLREVRYKLEAYCARINSKP